MLFQCYLILSMACDCKHLSCIAFLAAVANKPGHDFSLVLIQIWHGCCLIAAVLADGFWLCPWVPGSTGCGVDDPVMGVWHYDATRGDGRAGEHLPAPLTDHTREHQQELLTLLHRP